MWQELVKEMKQGNRRALARIISLVENEYDGYFEMLQQLLPSTIPVTGITGPPGAGKSTLADAIVGQLVNEGKRVGVLCVDPSSPFNLGALLGDRIRMSAWYNHPDVFIRSLASRGSLGGLHPHIIEITDVMKAAGFDHIIIETVGVGQSEVEIAGLADTTIVVFVPEAGDEIQTMKSGLMEIADIFVVNKADRDGADLFVRNLHRMLEPVFHAQPRHIPVLKTIAETKTGIDELIGKILQHQLQQQPNDRRYQLLAQKAFHLIQQTKMKEINKAGLINLIRQESSHSGFNLYQFVSKYF